MYPGEQPCKHEPLTLWHWASFWQLPQLLWQFSPYFPLSHSTNLILKKNDFVSERMAIYFYCQIIRYAFCSEILLLIIGLKNIESNNLCIWTYFCYSLYPGILKHNLYIDPWIYRTACPNSLKDTGKNTRSQIFHYILFKEIQLYQS